MNPEYQQSDEKILKSSIKNPWMFGFIVDRYQKVFLRRATSILHSKDSAEDVVQETFIKIYKYAPKFVEVRGASFKSWAYKILTNTSYSHAVKMSTETRRVRGLEFEELDTLRGIDDSAMREQVSFVHSILSKMPERLRRLLTLYFFEDMSYEEIAREEKLSLSAVRSGLHRARVKFKNVAIDVI